MFALTGYLALISVWLGAIAAYITHIVWAVKFLMNMPEPINIGLAILAAIGTVMPPVGIIHGLILWFS